MRTGQLCRAGTVAGVSPIARALAAPLLAVAVAACGSDDPGDGADATASPTVSPTGDEDTTSAATSDDAPRYPDVVEATAIADGDRWTFSATISSPYDSPERYADAFRVIAPDGTVLGVRELTHDHAAEQPFTRSLTGVAVPDDITDVTVEGRDLVNGWGGATVQVTLQR